MITSNAAERDGAKNSSSGESGSTGENRSNPAGSEPAGAATRNGKVARLPREVREELNRRLRDGEEGKKLVAWLNAQPEVQSLMASRHGGRPIREQSLSEWKKGGYRDWLKQEQLFEVAVRLGQENLEQEGGRPFMETVAIWLAARYAVLVKGQLNTGDLRNDVHLLGELCRDVDKLRRSGHRAECLQRAGERRERRRTSAPRRKAARNGEAGKPMERGFLKVNQAESDPIRPEEIANWLIEELEMPEPFSHLRQPAGDTAPAGDLTLPLGQDLEKRFWERLNQSQSDWIRPRVIIPLAGMIPVSSLRQPNISW